MIVLLQNTQFMNLAVSTTALGLLLIFLLLLCFQQAIDDAIVSASRARMTHIALFPPGQVIFIEENNPERYCA